MPEVKDFCDQIVEGLKRKVLILWILQVTAVVAVLSLFTAGAIASKIVPENVGLLPLLLEISGIAYMYFRYRNWSFELRNDHLFLDHGVFKRTRSMVPYVRVQHIDTQRTFFYRILGLSKVVVYTAGSKGADVTIPGLARDDASGIQEKLRDLAIESDERDAV